MMVASTGEGQRRARGRCATRAAARDPRQRTPLPTPFFLVKVLGVVSALVLSGGVASSWAADELALRGSAIAAEKCGRCHAVGVADASPHKITPPLRELHVDYPLAMLTEALKTGVVGGHDEMPMFDLGIDGARALVAYIDSLNPKSPQYLDKAP
ncbi:MAG: hypothetical protein R3D44_01215 [Hyphomicrobiaceae bacterium]